MATITTIFLVRHAKAADRDLWTGADRDRPLVDRGRSQAERLARALAPERPALVRHGKAMPLPAGATGDS